jgi:hypothetical protein
MPTYELSPGRPGPIDPAGADPWHLVGSPGLLALAHASGRTSLYATASGMARFADRSGRWLVDGVEVVDPEATFGCGWASWSGEAAGVRVRRRLDADPDRARLRIRWEVEADHPVTIREEWTVDHLPLVAGALMARAIPPPSTHRGLDRVVWRVAFALSTAVRAATDGLRRLLGRRYPLRVAVVEGGRSLRWEPVRRPRPPRGPTVLRRDLPAIALLALDPPDAAAPFASCGASRSDGSSGTVELRVDPGPSGAASVTLELALDAGHDPRVDAPAAHPGRPDHPAHPVDHATRGAAGSGPVGLDGLEAPAPLVAEARWNLTQLRGLRVPDACTGHTFVMQGSAYAFVHGLHGAPRDEALVAVPLSVLDPVTARQAVLAIAAMVAPDGSLHYAHTGYGRTVSGGVHAKPTDLPLFFLWALTEHVWATGDRSLLDERPRPFGRRAPAEPERSTVGELACASLRWLDERVGTGEHGMLRVGSGDWSDPIALMVRSGRAFHRRGESAFNAGMACYVLPRYAQLVEHGDPATARRARALAEAQAAALEEAWTGRWYLRGWDGRGGAIGRDHCFLDAQVWALIAGVGGPERGRALAEEVGRRLDDPSPIGPTILDRPHRVRLGLLADGWDCNGGVWAALVGLAAWGTSLHDPDRAWRMLARSSFAGQAAAYPRFWFGRWSGPDARNAHFGDRPGDTFVHPATPMTEFPTMNSNAHAGPLLGLLRVAGITVGPDGVDGPPRPSLGSGTIGRPGPGIDAPPG